MIRSPRFDKKCGNGAVSEGENCTKGSTPSTGRATRRRFPRRSAAQKGLMAGGIATTLGGLGYAAVEAARGRIGHTYGGLAAANAGLAAVNYSSAMEAERTGHKGTARTRRQAAAGNLAFGALAGTGAHIEGRRAVRRRAEAQAQARQYARAKAGSEYAKRTSAKYAAGENPFGSKRQAQQRRPGGTRPNSAVPDPYGDLGVSEKASDADIKRAWKDAMARHHPDRGGDPEKAARINAAYQEILRRRGRRDSIWANGFPIPEDDSWL